MFRIRGWMVLALAAAVFPMLYFVRPPYQQYLLLFLVFVVVMFARQAPPGGREAARAREAQVVAPPPMVSFDGRRLLHVLVAVAIVLGFLLSPLLVLLFVGNNPTTVTGSMFLLMLASPVTLIIGFVLAIWYLRRAGRPKREDRHYDGG